MAEKENARRKRAMGNRFYKESEKESRKIQDPAIGSAYMGRERNAMSPTFKCYPMMGRLSR